jgi:alcohol dehydrogenase, propanol-preferring
MDGFSLRFVISGFSPEQIAVPLNSRTDDAGAKLRALGGADAILATAPSGKAMSGLVNGLAVRGKLLVIGLAPDRTVASAPSARLLYRMPPVAAQRGVRTNPTIGCSRR